MKRKYYNEAYFILGQIDDSDIMSATLFTCMKMWADEHNVDFLPWFLQFVKDSYEVETGRNFYKDIFDVGIDATLGKDLRWLKSFIESE